MIDKTGTKLKSLSRYTSITALLSMLESKKLHLSNPENWKDRTDVAFLKKYAENENKKIRVLCFFECREKNHYWELYAKYGCLIEFNKEILFSKINGDNNFEFKKVEHIKQSDFNFEKHKGKLPFIKQLRYRDEKEYRLVWKGSNEKAVIPIDFESIEKIVISGDIDKKQADSLKKVIRKIANGALNNININHSELYESGTWISKLNTTNPTIGAKR